MSSMWCGHYQAPYNHNDRELPLTPLFIMHCAHRDQGAVSVTLLMHHETVLVPRVQYSVSIHMWSRRMRYQNTSFCCARTLWKPWLNTKRSVSSCDGGLKCQECQQRFFFTQYNSICTDSTIPFVLKLLWLLTETEADMADWYFVVRIAPVLPAKGVPKQIFFSVANRLQRVAWLPRISFLRGVYEARNEKIFQIFFKVDCQSCASSAMNPPNWSAAL